MDRRDSPLSISTKFKLIVSDFVKKNASQVQDYENILVFFLWRVNFSVWCTNSEHTEFITIGNHISDRLINISTGGKLIDMKWIILIYVTL